MTYRIGLALCIVAVMIGLGAIALGVALALSPEEEPSASEELEAPVASPAQREPSMPEDGDVDEPESTVAPVELGHYGEVRSLSVADVARRVDPVWVIEAANVLDIPPRAMASYAGASNAANEHYPQCGLGWNTLAAIGHVESDHGRIHGSEIDDDGVAIPSIVGIALTGSATASHPDTDGGVLDGDTTWDRAVGPMQFIPSTWILYAADGNGDGVADPQNIDDAALAAAAYLCDVGGDLGVAQNWIRAVAAYNHSVEYNNRVADAANHYAQIAP